MTDAVSPSNSDYTPKQVIDLLREGVMDLGEAHKYTREALVKLRELGDIEVVHGLADDLLCALLSAVGYKDVAEAFEELDKWYA